MGPQRVVSTFHQSTSVLASVKCRLTSSDEEHLVTAKLNRLDIYSITPDGLKQESFLNIQGSVVALQALQPQNANATLLLLLDHPDPELIILRTIADADSVHLTHVKTINLRENTALRPAEFFHDIVVDPSGTAVVVSCYASKLKVIQFSKEGHYEGEFDATISESNVLSMTFLPEEREPTLAILYVDHQNRTRLLSREVNVSELEVSAPSPALPLTDIPAKVASSSLDSNRFLVPISAVDGCAGGGVLVCGGRKWALYEAADTETRGELKEVSKSSRKRTRNQKKSQEETGALKRKANALIEWPWSEVRTYCSIDSTRVLVGDTFGRIAMLSLASINTTGIILMPLGQASSPTCMTYLGNQVIYLGSHSGDSQVILISAKPTSDLEAPTLPIPRSMTSSRLGSNKGKGKSTDMDVDLEDEVQVANNALSGYIAESRGSRLDVLMSQKNIAPIQDALLVEIDAGGQQKQLVVCSGGQNTGALHVIRAGTEIEITATLQGISHVTQSWPLKVYREHSGLREYHEMIVVSTIENTQIFRIDNQHTFSAEPSSAQGFSTNERTICAGNLAQKLADGKYPCQYVAQVTATGVYLVKYNETLRQYDREDGWDAQERLGPNSKIAVASINNSQVLLALGGGRIVVLNVANGKLNTQLNFLDGGLQGPTKPTPLLPAEISAVTGNTPSQNANFAKYFAVAYWASQEVVVYTYAGQPLSFKSLCKSSSLPAPVRSLLFFDFKTPLDHTTKSPTTFLLAGLSNGALAIMSWAPGDKNISAVLGEPRIIPLGDLPIMLSTCSIGGTQSVFTIGSRMTLVGFKSGRVTLSPIIVESVHAASYINSAGYPDSLVMSSSSGLVIGQITSQETLNVRAIPMGSSIPRCIRLLKDLGVYAVVTRSVDPPRVGDSEIRIQSDLRLLDAVNFNHLSRFNCSDKEEIVSLAVGPTGDVHSPYTVAGTYLYDSSEVEPTHGRILAFTTERVGSSVSLQLKAELQVHGCVYALTAIRPTLFAAAVNSAVAIYSVSETTAGSGPTNTTIEKVTEWNHNYTVTQLVFVDGKIIVGDQISSISIVELTGLDGEGSLTLKTLARDYLPLWPVSIQAGDQEGLSVVGANDALNLFSFTVKESRGRKILRKDGEFHLGELVTKIVQGSITSTESHGLKGSHIWFTSSGKIGSLVEATDATAEILTEAQQEREMRIERQRNETAGATTRDDTVGGESHAKFRAPKSTRGRSDADPAAYGFIDGDFILRELDEDGMHVDGYANRADILGVLESIY